MKREDVLTIVREQAEDEGLWFIARTAPEAYLQAALRRLHAAVETHTVGLPCRLFEYDGAFCCFTHNRQWGAITNPSEPCPGWVAK